MSWEGCDPEVNEDPVGWALLRRAGDGKERDSAWKCGCSGAPEIAKRS